MNDNKKDIMIDFFINDIKSKLNIINNKNDKMNRSYISAKDKAILLDLDEKLLSIAYNDIIRYNLVLGRHWMRRQLVRRINNE